MAGATLSFDILARDKASPTLDKVGKKVDGLSTKTVAFGSFIGNAMTSGVAAVGRMGIAAAKMGITTAASLEQAQVGFTTLIGSGAKAQVFLGKLQKFAASTPFELPGLIDSSRLLLGVGVSADKVIPTLTAFGDAAGAVGVGQEAFQRIMLATSQAVSAGRFQVGDLNQIVTNGIPAWKLLSEATGKPVPVLREMAAKGQLLSKDVLPALQKQMEKDYGGAMAKQSKTLNGVWSTLMDTLNIGLANVLKPLVPYLEDIIPKAAAVLQGALGGAGKGIEVFLAAFTGKSEVNEFDGALKTINNAAITLGATFRVTETAVGIFWDAFSGKSEINEFNGAMKLVNNAGITAREVYDDATGIMKAFGTAVGDTIGFLTRHHDILKVTIGVVLGLVAVTKAYNTALAIQTAGGVVKWLWDAVKVWRAVTIATEAATAAQWALNVAQLANPIGVVILAVVALIGALVLLWRNNDTFRRITIKTWDAVKGAIGTAVDWVTGTAVPAITGAWDTVSDGAVGLWRQMVSIWDGIVGAVEAGVHSVLEVGRSVGHAFAEVGRGFAAAAGIVGDVFGAIASAVMTVLAPIGQAFGFLFRIAKPFFDLLYIGWQIVDRANQIAIKSFEILFIIIGRLFSALGPVIVAGLRAIGDGFTWLGHVSLLGIYAIGDGLTWLYNNAVKPAVAAIGAALRVVGGWFTWLYDNAIAPALHAAVVAMNAVGAAAMWLWRIAVVPALRAIGDAATTVWDKVLAPALHGIEAGFRAVGTAVTFVWQKVLLPTFNALKDFVENKIAPAFKAGVAAISAAWDDLKEKAKEPVRFVVKVINDGIIDPFNKVAGSFGVKGVDHINLPKGFAKGGVFNEPTAIVGEGGPDPEYVIPTDRKHRKRALALYQALGAKLMASGGVMDWLSNPADSARNALSPYLSKLGSIEKSPFGKLAAAVPRALASHVGDFLKDKAGSALSGFSGGYKLFAGLSPAESWIVSHESGGNVNARNPTSTAFGLGQLLIANRRHYGAILGVDPDTTNYTAQLQMFRMYVRDRYGTPENAEAFWKAHHWYGNGGTITEPIIGRGLRTGQTYGFGERGPETVIPGRLSGAGGDTHYHFHMDGAVIGSRQQMDDWLTGSIERLRRQGRR